jgi:hypothetical protein
LFAKELREIISGRSPWMLLLLECPLIGYSFFQSLALYGEASSAAAQSPVLATTLSPLDGILVPTLGSFYVAATLLFPFVAIRVLGEEKQSGALRLLVQLPYRTSTLVGVKLFAVLTAWLVCALPAFSALLVEDPRYIDLTRNVLAKLQRAMPRVSSSLAGGRSVASSASDDAYGEIEYRYGTKSDKSRSTSPREILPLIYGLAGAPPPTPIPSAEYPGYPLIADGTLALLWFLAVLPTLIILACWRSRRLPPINRALSQGRSS